MNIARKAAPLAALLCALGAAPACSLLVDRALDNRSLESSDGGGDAGDGGDAGSDAGGSDAGIDSGCGFAIIDGNDGGPLVGPVLYPAYHSAALPSPSAPGYAAVAFVANGRTYLVLTGASDTSVSAIDVSGVWPREPSQVAVGPGRTISGEPCASVLTILGDSPADSWLSGPPSCWNSTGTPPQSFPLSSSNGVALGGIGDAAHVTIISAGTDAQVCEDRHFPNCAGQSITFPTMPAPVADGGWRVLDLLVEDGGAHILVATDGPDAGALADLTNSSLPLPGPQFVSPLATTPYSSQLAGAQLLVLEYVYSDGANKILERALYAPPLLTAVGGPIVDAQADPASLHLLAVDRASGASAVRSVWLADGGVFMADLDNPADDVNAKFSLPRRDSCGSDITFAAPLNAGLIFTVDRAHNARVHRVPSNLQDSRGVGH